MKKFARFMALAAGVLLLALSFTGCDDIHRMLFGDVGDLIVVDNTSNALRYNVDVKVVKGTFVEGSVNNNIVEKYPEEIVCERIGLTSGNNGSFKELPASGQDLGTPYFFYARKYISSLNTGDYVRIKKGSSTDDKYYDYAFGGYDLVITLESDGSITYDWQLPENE